MPSSANPARPSTQSLGHWPQDPRRGIPSEEEGRANPSASHLRVLAEGSRARRRDAPTRQRANTPTRKLVITIDGPAGVGKSTAAKLLAQRLGLMYLDTGATYRALAYAVLRAGLHPIADASRLAAMARRLPLKFHPGPQGSLRVTLAGVDVTQAIRTEEVSEASAQISQYPAVRAALVRRQRGFAGWQGVVVEGRDTGSIVFPQAPYKFFLDATPRVRAKRRQAELAHLYGTKPPLVQVQEQLHFRDGLDRTRRVGPLVKPVGAVAIDTTRLTARQVVRIMLRSIHQHQI